MEAKGIFKRAGNTKQVSEKFKNRTFDIETTDGKYKQVIRFELSQDRCDLIDSYQLGEELEVSFNLNGREWQKTPEDDVVVFNTLSAWKIMATPLQNGTNNTTATTTVNTTTNPKEFGAPLPGEEESDLPF